MPKYLVIRFSSIGDIVLTSPVVRMLKKQVPHAEVHFLTKKTFESVVANNPFIDKLWTTDGSLKDVLPQLKNEKFDEIRVSGSLESHYSPKAKVLLNAIAQSGEGLIALSDIPTPAGAVRLASPKTNDEYARVLYAALRDADARELKTVVAIEPEGDDIALAIRDRLKRASA